MKKIIGFLISTLFLISYSGNFESQAKEQMEKTFKELAKDPSSVELSNIETQFKNDSICIIHLKFSGKNGFGAVSSTKYEYIYCKDISKNSIREAVVNLEKDKSVLQSAKEMYKDKEIYDAMINEEHKTDEEAKAFCIYFYAWMQTLASGRDVGEKSEDLNSPDNW